MGQHLRRHPARPDGVFSYLVDRSGASGRGRAGRSATVRQQVGVSHAHRRPGRDRFERGARRRDARHRQEACGPWSGRVRRGGSRPQVRHWRCRVPGGRRNGRGERGRYRARGRHRPEGAAPNCGRTAGHRARRRDHRHHGPLRSPARPRRDGAGRHRRLRDGIDAAHHPRPGHGRALVAGQPGRLPRSHRCRRRIWPGLAR